MKSRSSQLSHDFFLLIAMDEADPDIVSDKEEEVVEGNFREDEEEGCGFVEEDEGGRRSGSLRDC